ncbi:hypothetical protein ACQ4PT_027481 [Festuca glaucescens]
MLELSYNSISGSLRTDIGDLLPELYFLSMFSNELVGEIPASLANASAMQTINLGENNLVSVVPADLGALRELAHLGLSVNMLQAATPSEWQFLDALTNCSKLQVLHMYHNDLSGELPASVANLSTELLWLDFAYNRISGTIPSGIGSVAGLTTLRLEANNFTGVIPESVGLLTDMCQMLLYENRLTGTIPSSLGNLAKMTHLELSQNELVGELPPSLASCGSLAYLSVGGNRLTGTIPAQVFTISAMSNILNLSNNFLSSELPMEVGHRRNIPILDLSNNRLTGAIPATIGLCQMLQGLYLDGNLLSGGVPPSLFGDLKGLEELDMSRNNLSGEFPRVLQDMRYLRLLNLSFNRLAGEVPVKGVFANATAVHLTGNDDLCGGIGELHLPPCAGQAAATDPSLAVKLAVPIVCIAFAAVVVCVSLLAWRRKKASPKVATPMEEQHPKVSYAELSTATNRFSPSNLIGEAWRGGCTRSPARTRGGGSTLTLLQRLNAAVDVASALDYLHNDCEVPIAHCDLKLSNVLLDGDMVARVGDFGLARFLDSAEPRG